MAPGDWFRWPGRSRRAEGDKRSDSRQNAFGRINGRWQKRQPDPQAPPCRPRLPGPRPSRSRVPDSSRVPGCFYVLTRQLHREKVRPTSSQVGSVTMISGLAPLQARIAFCRKAARTRGPPRDPSRGPATTARARCLPDPRRIRRTPRRDTRRGSACRASPGAAARSPCAAAASRAGVVRVGLRREASAGAPATSMNRSRRRHPAGAKGARGT